MQKLVYVASPYRGLEFKDELSKKADIECVSFRGIAAKLEAKKACERLKYYGYVPISPILSFSEIYSEIRERKEALQAGFILLRACDYIYVHKCDGWDKSEGIKEELKKAEKWGIQEIEPELEPEKWLGY